MSKFIQLLLLVSFVLLLNSCKQDAPKIDTDQIVTRMAISPKGLNPLINLTGPDLQLASLMFYPLGDYNPSTLRFEPILADAFTPEEKITEGANAGGVKYNFTIREDATWDNGSPITAADYLFTTKAVFHPKSNAIKYRAYMGNIADVVTYPEKPKSLSVIFKQQNISSFELAASLPILPKHIYDPSNALDKVQLADLRDEAQYTLLSASDAMLDSFATRFNSIEFSRETIQGSGRYKFKKWLNDQYVSLERKENHWLDNSSSDRTAAEAKELVFLITPDEAVAFTQFKSGEFDVYSGLSVQQADDLKSNDAYKDKFEFHSVKVPRYYYLSINTRKPHLRDKKVRQALAHLMDVDTLIASYEKGLGERINSPFLSVDDRSTLADIRFDRKKADDLLANAGWKDTNSNGILDKMIDNQLVELEVDFVMTGSQLGKLISGLYKQLAKPSGVNINVIPVDRTQYKTRLDNLDFDMLTSARSQSLAPYDPYPLLHTDNTDPGEGNIFAFGNESSNALIETIRSTTDSKIRDEAYLDLEKIIADEQPIIFLYSPMEQIVHSSNVDGVVSVVKPGYAINTFKKVK